MAFETLWVYEILPCSWWIFARRQVLLRPKTLWYFFEGRHLDLELIPLNCCLKWPWHFEACAEWSPFHRRYFRYDFIKWGHFSASLPLWGESTGHRWIPLIKARDDELWCFFLICAWTNNWGGYQWKGLEFEQGLVLNWGFYSKNWYLT